MLTPVLHCTSNKCTHESKISIDCIAGFEKNPGVLSDCSGFPCSTQGVLQLCTSAHHLLLFILLCRLAAILSAMHCLHPDVSLLWHDMPALCAALPYAKHHPTSMRCVQLCSVEEFSMRESFTSMLWLAVFPVPKESASHDS